MTLTGRRGKHSRHCQSSSVFEDMALLISLLSPKAKEGRAPLGMGWLWDLRVGMRASKEGESSGWVFNLEHDFDIKFVIITPSESILKLN